MQNSEKNVKRKVKLRMEMEMCQGDNNLTKDQTTAEVKQWVFNAVRTSGTVRRASAGP